MRIVVWPAAGDHLGSKSPRDLSTRLQCCGLLLQFCKWRFVDPRIKQKSVDTYTIAKFYILPFSYRIFLRVVTTYFIQYQKYCTFLLRYSIYDLVPSSISSSTQWRLPHISSLKDGGGYGSHAFKSTCAMRIDILKSRKTPLAAGVPDVVHASFGLVALNISNI